jgi:hypothetical protein
LDWLRWWHGTVNDPKFIWLAQKSKTNVATVIAVWAAILEHASQEDDRGCVAGFDPESYDCSLGVEEGTSFRVMEAMQIKGLLASGRIANWDGRQPKRERDDDSKERVAKHRERQRNADVTPVTPSNALDKIREEKKEEGAAAPFVDGLDPKAWEAWVSYRKTIGKSLNPKTFPLAQKQMAALGKAQMSAVEHSIANNYRGLFAPAENGKAPKGDRFAGFV